MVSGAGTNLKVGGGTGPARKCPAPIPREAPEKNFWSCLSAFFALIV